MARAILVETETARAPEGGEVSVVIAPDGVELRAARWPVPQGTAARGTVVLLNGRTEFIEKYFEVIGELRERGFAVLTMDWRGQGLSSRMLTNHDKGHVGDFAHFESDALLVMDSLLTGDMPRPVIVMAHSMGGNVALRLLQNHGDRFARGVLCAPMTGIHTDGPPAWLVRLLARIFDSLGFGVSFAFGQKPVDLEAETFEANSVTRDAARFERTLTIVTSEPALALGGVTWHWLRAAFNSIDQVTARARVKALTMPVLLASAGEEKFVDPKSHERLARLNERITLVSFPDALHEILMERSEIRARFWDSFDAFTADLPAGAGPER